MRILLLSIIIIGDAGEVSHEEVLESQNMTKSFVPQFTNIKHNSKENQDHLDIQQPFRPATEEAEEDEEGEIDGDLTRARVLWVKSLSRLRAKVNSIIIMKCCYWGRGPPCALMQYLTILNFVFPFRFVF